MNSNIYAVGRKKYVFWQHRPSAHQAPFIRELAELSDIEVILVVNNAGLSEERLAQGWNLPNYGKTRILIKPDAAIVEELISVRANETVHIFSFLSSDRYIKGVFTRCYGSGALLGLLSEGRDWRGVKGFLRKTHGFFNERKYQSKLNFVLAIGDLSKQWYNKNGFSLEKLYDFCYVVEEPDYPAVYSNADDSFVKLIYVGQLNDNKRVNLLIKALSLSGETNFTLDIIGAGKELIKLKEMTQKVGLEEHVSFLGVLNNSEVYQKLSHSDVLVLPSHWDGWGAVVNEALMCGTPVICSDYCGAADLVQANLSYGEVFECDSAESLAKVLKKWLFKGAINLEDRAKIKQYSKLFNGSSVAQYLTKIVVHEGEKDSIKAVAPWYVK